MSPKAVEATCQLCSFLDCLVSQGWPRIRRRLCFPATILLVEPRKLLFVFHICMKSAGWVARQPCTWYAGSHVLPHMPPAPRAGSGGAAPSPSQTCPWRAGGRGGWRGEREAGLVFVYSYFKSKKYASYSLLPESLHGSIKMSSLSCQVCRDNTGWGALVRALTRDWK